MTTGARGRIKRQNQPGLGLGATVMHRAHAESAVKPVESGEYCFDMGKARVPQQRTVSKYPKIHSFSGPTRNPVLELGSKPNRVFHMRNLNRLITFAIIAALGWGAYWFVGAQAAQRGLEAWFDARRDDGWTAETTTVATTGFPSRFETTVEELEIDDPGTGVGWSVPWVQVQAKSHKPTHLTAALAPIQELRLPNEVLDIVSNQMRGTVEVGTTPSLPLDRLMLEGEAMKIASTLGWTADLSATQVTLTENPTRGAPSYDLAITLDGFAPKSDKLAKLRRVVALPERIDALSAELTVTFDKPWNLSRVDVRRPQPRELVLDRLTAQWGKLAISGAGQVRVSPDGVASGKITLEATNWRDILKLADATGAIAKKHMPLVETALKAIARQAANPNRVKVPLRFADGKLLIGPAPICPVPPIVLP